MSVHSDPFRFSHRLRVRWGECDMQGIVFNPHYMAYVDVALTEYWRTIGVTYPAALLADGNDVFMAAASQTYRDAARFDDEVDVALRIGALGNTSLRLAFEVRRLATVLVHGEATYVVAGRESRKPTPLPAWLIDAVVGYEPTRPERKR